MQHTLRLIVTEDLLPVSSRWGNHLTSKFSCVMDWDLIKHVKLGNDWIIYTEVITTFCLMANTTLQLHCRPTKADNLHHDVEDFLTRI